MGKIVLNADLGEGETSSHSAEFIQCVGAANIACGGHAGDDESIRHCLEACIASDTLPGAHPGIAANFGRNDELPSPDEFSKLLESQWSTISQIADSLGISLHHIKLHGSLYMAVERAQDLADVYLNFLNQLSPCPVIFSLTQGSFQQQCQRAGLQVWGELFADREYESDATLRSRKHSDALIHDTNLIEKRVLHWLEHGEILSSDSTLISLEAKTICLHSDTPSALITARRLQQLLSCVRK